MQGPHPCQSAKGGVSEHFAHLSRQRDGGQHCFPHHPHEYLCGRIPLCKLRLQRRPGLLFCQGQQRRAGDPGPLDTRERPHQQQLRCHGRGRYRQKHRGQAHHALGVHEGNQNPVYRPGIRVQGYVPEPGRELAERWRWAQRPLQPFADQTGAP